MKRILAISLDFTSTRLALYADREVMLMEKLEHPVNEIRKHECIQSQFDLRNNGVLELLKENGISIESLDLVVCRGGILPPEKSEVYEINNMLVNRLKDIPTVNHVSDLGVLMAFKIAESAGIPVYVCYSSDVVQVETLALGVMELIGGQEVKEKWNNKVY